MGQQATSPSPRTPTTSTHRSCKTDSREKGWPSLSFTLKIGSHHKTTHGPRISPGLGGCGESRVNPLNRSIKLWGGGGGLPFYLTPVLGVLSP